jgi:hypothetical protein
MARLPRHRFRVILRVPENPEGGGTLISLRYGRRVTQAALGLARNGTAVTTLRRRIMVHTWRFERRSR